MVFRVELKSPEDARLMPNPPHSVTVLWTRPDRTGSLGKDCNGIAYAPHYIISYCPVKHCEETGKNLAIFWRVLQNFLSSAEAR